MAEITLKVKVEGDKVVSASLDGLDKKAKSVSKSTKQTTTQLTKLAKVGKSINSGFTSLKDTFFSLQTAALAFASAFAVKEVVEAANEQENAVNRLNVALQTAGDFSLEASESFQVLASELQATTKFGDELILNNIALAKSFGATNDQAQDIAKAATDLSAAFDIDLESATRNVAKTLGGFAGELGEVIPALKDLTAEELKAGKGIELLAAQFQGAAQGQVKTFSGALSQLQNTFGDLLEEVGFLITQNPVLIGLVSELSSVFSALGKEIKNNRDDIISFSQDGIKLVIETGSLLAQAFIGLIKIFNNFRIALNLAFSGFGTIAGFVVDGVATIVGAFEKLIGIIRFDIFDPLRLGFISLAKTATDQFIKMNRGFRSLASTFGENILTKTIDKEIEVLSSFSDAFESTSKDIKEANEESSKSITGISDSIRETSKDLLEFGEFQAQEAVEISNNNEKIASTFDKIGSAITEGTSKALSRAGEEGVKAGRSIASGAKVAVSAVKEIGKSSKQASVDLIKFVNELKDGLLDIGATAAADPFKAARLGLEALERRFDDISPKLTKEQVFKLRAQIEAAAQVQIIGVSAGFAKEILSGAAGAGKLLAEGGALAVDTIAPGVGQAIKPLLTAFQKGPEETRKAVREFAKALPIILRSIAEAAPAFIEELIIQIPNIINALVDATPEIITSLIEQLPSLIFELGKAMPEVALALALAMPQVAFELLANLLPGFRKLGELVATAGEKFFELIKKAGEILIQAANFIFERLKQVGQFILNVFKEVGELLKAAALAIVKAGTRIFDLLKQGGELLVRGFRFLFNGLLDIGKRFFDFIIDGAKMFIDKLLEGIKKIFSAAGDLLGNIPVIGDVAGSSGGVGGLIGGAVGGVGGAITGALGGLFAKGGRVPTGFPNDSFPAGLTSNEFVIDNSLTPKLERFLNSQEGGDVGDSIERDILLDIADALNQPMNVSTQVEFNGDVLADIILQLNRSNRRLA